MGINTITSASIYELQGHFDEALMIYDNILSADPMNKKALQGKRRILDMQQRQVAKESTDSMIELFKNAKSAKDFEKLENWLST